MSILKRGKERRARRALERQLAYQRQKAERVKGHEREMIASMVQHSRAVRERIETVAPIPPGAKALEVGCGAHGLIFFFEAAERVGVDPLADHYRNLFPAWQDRAVTIASGGETLPFEDGAFDVVLCDNVVDHALSPRGIVEEMTRVLAPGGLLYFTVNVHHPFYHVAASAHAAWRALGVPVEITPFADHTVHLTPAAARRLFKGLPLRVAHESDNVDEVKKSFSTAKARHAGDLLKRPFYKNARYEMMAVRR